MFNTLTFIIALAFFSVSEGEAHAQDILRYPISTGSTLLQQLVDMASPQAR